MGTPREVCPEEGWTELRPRLVQAEGVWGKICRLIRIPSKFDLI